MCTAQLVHKNMRICNDISNVKNVYTFIYISSVCMKLSVLFIIHTNIGCIDAWHFDNCVYTIIVLLALGVLPLNAWYSYMSV